MAAGRPRDAAAERRILDATFRLIGERGCGQVRIDDIASAAGVGKQTIYRWWPTRSAVVLDALLAATLVDTPFPLTDSARGDFRTHLRSVARLFASPSGALIREMVAESQADPAVADDFRTRFWAPRRELSLARLERGIAEGQVRRDIPREPALDALYGPLWIGLLVSHRALDARYADEVLDAVWAGVEARPVSDRSAAASASDSGMRRGG
jgi:AcrR family transcriptional regulator